MVTVTCKLQSIEHTTSSQRQHGDRMMSPTTQTLERHHVSMENRRYSKEWLVKTFR